MTCLLSQGVGRRVGRALANTWSPLRPKIDRTSLPVALPVNGNWIYFPEPLAHLSFHTSSLLTGRVDDALERAQGREVRASRFQTPVLISLIFDDRSWKAVSGCRGNNAKDNGSDAVPARRSFKQYGFSLMSAIFSGTSEPPLSHKGTASSKPRNLNFHQECCWDSFLWPAEGPTAWSSC